MSAFKGTPGPWLVVNGDEWTSDVATDDPIGGLWNVASANTRRDAWQANRAAIAQVPAMVEALLAVNRCGNGGAKLSREASDKTRSILAALREGGAL